MITSRFQELTDEQLVAHYKATNKSQVLGEIYRRFYDKVYYTCFGIVKDKHAACDLVHDVMLKVIEKLPTLQNGFLLGLWIHRIARNESIDFCKQRRNHRYVPAEDGLELEDELTDFEALLVKEKQLENMEMAMHQLEKEARHLLTLKYWQSCTIEELQNRYAISPSAVKMRLSRARRRLVKLYQQSPPVELCA